PLVELDPEEERREGGQLVLVPVETGRGHDARDVPPGVRRPPASVPPAVYRPGGHEPVEEREGPARRAPLDPQEVGHLVVPVDHLRPVVVVHRRSPPVGPYRPDARGGGEEGRARRVADRGGANGSTVPPLAPRTRGDERAGRSLDAMARSDSRRPLASSCDDGGRRQPQHPPEVDVVESDESARERGDVATRCGRCGTDEEEEAEGWAATPLSRTYSDSASPSSMLTTSISCRAEAATGRPWRRRDGPNMPDIFFPSFLPSSPILGPLSPLRYSCCCLFCRPGL
ncbi:hypothetical protein THAOC_11471, partial [Thalassiosira oceanica]